MFSSTAQQIYPEALRTLAFGAISGAYAAIGTPTTNPTRIYWLQNDTNATLTFSWDGVTDMFVLPAFTFVLLDCTTNRSDKAGYAAVPANTTTYVKGAPGSGSVYLTVFYAKTGY